MPLPFTIGGGLSEPDVIDFARALKALLPDGYSRSETSLFFYELEACAVVFKYVHEQRRRVLGNMFARTTTEMIGEWEHAFRLAGDALREISERQQRLVGAESARGGASAPRIETALAALEPASFLAVVPIRQALIADARLDNETPELIFQLLVAISEEDFATTRTQHAAATLLNRIVPARSLGQDGAPVSESLASAEAFWSEPTSVIGRASVPLVIGSGAVSDALMPPCRLRQYGPGTIIRARDLNALQDALLRLPCGGPFGDFAMQRAENVTIAFAATIAGGTYNVIDTSIDWRRRIGFLTIRHAPSAGFDIRPGHGDDTNFATDGTLYAEQIYFGEGQGVTVPDVSYTVALGTDLSLFADDATGNLVIANTGVDGHVAVGVLGAAAPYDDTSSSGMNRQLHAIDGTPFDVSCTDAFANALVANALLRPGNGAGNEIWTAWEGDGARRIVFYAVNVPASSTIEIDGLIDWRDRLITVTQTVLAPGLWSATNTEGGPLGASRHAGDPAFLVTPDMYTAPSTTSDPNASAIGFGYSGVGIASGTGAVGSMVELSDHARVWVSSVNGKLNLTRSGVGDDALPETFVLVIEATAQTGKRVTPPDGITLNVVTGIAPVVPSYLNVLQDRSLLGVAAHSHPLGLQPHEQHGHVAPKIPRARIAYGRTSSQQRSGVGQLRRWLTSGIGDGVDQIIDFRDWRDRFVRVAVRFSTTFDIRPGHADDTAANSTVLVDRCCVARYTGSGGHATVGSGLDVGYHVVLINDVAVEDTGLCVYADATSGVLRLRNKTGSTYYVTGWIDATFHLGTRDPAGASGLGFGL